MRGVRKMNPSIPLLDPEPLIPEPLDIAPSLPPLLVSVPVPVLLEASVPVPPAAPVPAVVLPVVVLPVELVLPAAPAVEPPAPPAACAKARLLSSRVLLTPRRPTMRVCFFIFSLSNLLLKAAPIICQTSA